MLERFIGKEVAVTVVLSALTIRGHGPQKVKGILTDVDNEAIIIDNLTYIPKRYISRLEVL